jgi:hypothetical protein
MQANRKKMDLDDSDQVYDENGNVIINSEIEQEEKLERLIYEA